MVKKFVQSMMFDMEELVCGHIVTLLCHAIFTSEEDFSMSKVCKVLNVDDCNECGIVHKLLRTSCVSISVSNPRIWTNLGIVLIDTHCGDVEHNKATLLQMLRVVKEILVDSKYN